MHFHDQSKRRKLFIKKRDYFIAIINFRTNEENFEKLAACPHRVITYWICNY